MDYFETVGYNNYHTDGDGDYEAEGFKFSEIENIKTIKRMLPKTRDNSSSSPIAQVPKCKRMCIRRLEGEPAEVIKADDSHKRTISNKVIPISHRLEEIPATSQSPSSNEIDRKSRKEGKKIK